MYTKLKRIAEIAENNPTTKFTSLIHLINKDMLIGCHNELSGNKATGVDKVTKAEYERNLKILQSAGYVEIARGKILLEIREFEKVARVGMKGRNG